jgi:hypothetical protein
MLTPATGAVMQMSENVIMVVLGLSFNTSRKYAVVQNWMPVTTKYTEQSHIVTKRKT